MSSTTALPKNRLQTSIIQLLTDCPHTGPDNTEVKLTQPIIPMQSPLITLKSLVEERVWKLLWGDIERNIPPTMSLESFEIYCNFTKFANIIADAVVLYLIAIYKKISPTAYYKNIYEAKVLLDEFQDMIGPNDFAKMERSARADYKSVGSDINLVNYRTLLAIVNVFSAIPLDDPNAL